MNHEDKHKKKHMPKKQTKAPDFSRVKINQLFLIIDRNGNVLVGNGDEEFSTITPDSDSVAQELSAADLDTLFKASTLLAPLKKAMQELRALNIPEYTETESHLISFQGDGSDLLPDITDLDGGVWIGCQYISPSDIQKVHKVSLFLRKKHNGRK